MSSSDRLCECGDLDMFLHHCMLANENCPQQTNRLHHAWIDGDEINVKHSYIVLDTLITMGKLDKPKPVMSTEEIDSHESGENYHDVHYRYFKPHDPNIPSFYPPVHLTLPPPVPIVHINNKRVQDEDVEMLDLEPEKKKLDCK